MRLCRSPVRCAFAAAVRSVYFWRLCLTTYWQRRRSLQKRKLLRRKGIAFPHWGAAEPLIRLKMPNSRLQKSLTQNRLSELWRARRYDLGAFSVLTLFFLIFFQPALFHGKFFVTSDAFIYSYPLRTLVWDQLRRGKLPLWTPHIMSGYPLLSMAQI